MHTRQQIVKELDVIAERRLQSRWKRYKFTGTIQEIFDHPTSIDDIGKRKELAIFPVCELSKRYLKQQPLPSTIHGPEDAADYARQKLAMEPKEHFCILLLNTKNHVIGWHVVSIGNLTGIVVHPREVFAPVIVHHAASIILAHNHPSGDPTPSKEDIAVTQRLMKAGKIMDIPVLDHIVIGGDGFISIKEKGLMSQI